MKINKQDLLHIKYLIEEGSITEKKFKNKEIVSELKLNGSVSSRRRKTIKYIDLNKEENLFLFLKNHGYNITSKAEIDSYIENMFKHKPSRDLVQQYHNNTKSKTSKSMHGLYLSSLRKIAIRLNGERVNIFPNDGLGYFFFCTQRVELFEDTIIVGVENYQVVWFSKRYEKFFAEPNILFVVTTPCMLEWLSTLENRYIHFGDYDLAGINIYLNKVVPRLSSSKKYNMYIPDDIEQLIEQYGNSELYENQKQYKSLLSNDDEINRLIEIIFKFKKGIEQEGLHLLSRQT